MQCSAVVIRYVSVCRLWHGQVRDVSLLIAYGIHWLGCNVPLLSDVLTSCCLVTTSVYYRWSPWQLSFCSCWWWWHLLWNLLTASQRLVMKPAVTKTLRVCCKDCGTINSNCFNSFRHFWVVLVSDSSKLWFIRLRFPTCVQLVNLVIDTLVDRMLPDIFLILCTRQRNSYNVRQLK